MRNQGMKNLALGVFALSLCVRLPAGADKPQGVSDYKGKFDQIIQVVSTQFYDKNLHKDRLKSDWGKMVAASRDKLKAVRTRTEFVNLVNELLEGLQASHSEYLPDTDMGFSLLKSVMGGGFEGNQIEHIGVMGTRQNGEFVVAGVLEGYPAQQAGLKSGDVLLQVNDKPFQTAGSFRGFAKKPMTLIYRRNGEQQKTTITPIKENPLLSFYKATERSIKTLTLDGKKIGYIHLWTMARDDFRALLEKAALDTLYNTEGLILDLRDGYGGRPQGYADPFFLPDVVMEQQPRGFVPREVKTGYGKPMVVLINKGTRSAKEFFAYEFKKTKRADLIGTTTAGAFLGARSFDIGEDGVLELPVVGLRVDGKRLEGVGVEPDVVVEPNATYEQDDAQMTEAKRVLMAKLAKSLEIKTIGH